MSSGTVMITMEGLMMLHFYKPGKYYELGVYGQAHCHQFTVCLDGTLCQLPPASPPGSYRSWVLSMVPGTGNTAIPPIASVDGNHRDRFDKTIAAEYDLSWIIDLEGCEFHNTVLSVNKEMLSPIIQLTTGQLSVSCKTFDVNKLQGGVDQGTFGYVSEVLMLEIPVQMNDQVVLTALGDGKPSGIPDFKVFHTTGPNHKVSILNTSDKQRAVIDRARKDEIQPGDLDFQSHLCMYYQVIEGVAVQDQYDLSPYDQNDVPPNVCLIPHTDTVSPFVCGVVLLGQRAASLD
jgi:hypothetical protein